MHRVLPARTYRPPSPSPGHHRAPSAFRHMLPLCFTAAALWPILSASGETDIEQAEALSRKTGRPILAVVGTDT